MPYRQGILLLLACLLSLPLPGRHLVGGELTYRCLGAAGAGLFRYEITLQLYRDCLPTFQYPTNTPFDRQASIHFFAAPTGELVAQRSFSMRDSSQLNLNSSDTCYAAPQNLCYAVATYRDTITLDAGSAYHVVWSRCCRNETIQNIRQPGNQGMVFSAYIPRGNWCNRSAVFRRNLPTFICLNADFSFDHGATDADGDSLVYELVRPYTAGSQNNPFPVSQPPPQAEVSWEAGYSLTNVMNGEPALSINARTGRLQVRPRQLGQYVFAIAVREYRQGQLMGEIRRDIQINVIDCPINLPPELVLPASDRRAGDTLFFRRGEASCFELESIDRNGAGVPPDFVQLEVEGAFFDPALGVSYELTAGTGRARMRLCWTPPCDTALPTPGFFVVESRDNNTCPAPHRVRDTVFVGIWPGTAAPPALTCVEMASGGPLLRWEALPPEQRSGFAAYVMEVNRGQGWQELAAVTDSQQDQYQDSVGQRGTCYRLRLRRACPEPQISEPGAARCAESAPVPALCQVSAEPDGLGVRVSWPAYLASDFAGYRLYRQGPGQPQMAAVWASSTAADIAWRDTAVTTGAYCYQLAVLNGCGTERRSAPFCLPQLSATAAEPLARLTWASPQTGLPSPPGLEIWAGDSLGNWTQRAGLPPDARRWDETVPIDAPARTCYRLRLVPAGHDCSEGSWSPPACLSFPPRLFFPNAFSPNGDGINDTWQPAGAFLTQYELHIFNRWGQRLFHTRQPGQGWDGRYRGQAVPEGVYTFRCLAQAGTGAPFVRQGTILLFR